MDDAMKKKLELLREFDRSEGPTYSSVDRRAVEDYAERLDAALELIQADEATRELVSALFYVLTGSEEPT